MTELAPTPTSAREDRVSRSSDTGLLRFLACGSVDDGKSTVIGRLLADTGSIFDDQLVTLERDSARHGTTGGIDYALLVDGLEAEREQGITIDIAWRSFATERRRFLIADAPGHEQYTRNMATGASACDLAIVLVDARHGVRPQTLRHTQIASLLGIRHIVLAINKMDLVGCRAERFHEIVHAFTKAAERHGLQSLQSIPVIARDGDNIVTPSERMPWYTGPSLLAHLETIDVRTTADARPMRLPVQYVNRMPDGARAYCGTLASGRLAAGDAVAVAGSGVEARVARIVGFEADPLSVGAGEPVTIVLDRELDISRGDVLADPRALPDVTDQLAADLVWLVDTPLIAGRPYLLKLGTRTVGASVARVRYRLDVETGQRLTAETLAMNDVGRVQIALAAPVAFEPYEHSRALGGFILIDRQSNATAGVGMVTEALRTPGVVWHDGAVDRAARARALGQRPAVVWLTGLSGAGKSTIAMQVERQLHALGRHAYVLDGDNVRHGLNRDLGFTEADRVENIRRAAEVARLMADAGLIVLVSFISPYRTDREMARERMGDIPFLETFVDTSVAECERRDTKGLYARARAGEIRNFTGVSAPYEPPERPDLVLPTAEADAETLAARVIAALREDGCLP